MPSDSQWRIGHCELATDRDGEGDKSIRWQRGFRSRTGFYSRSEGRPFRETMWTMPSRIRLIEAVGSAL